MDLTPIEIPPGVVTKPTKAKNSSNWRASNLMRWDNGSMEPIQPWEQIGYTPPTANFRATHQWRDNAGRTWNAFLSEDDIYVEYNGDLVSIAPTPAMEPFNPTTDGGYGDGLYSDSDYGTARSGIPSRNQYGPAFTMDNWGENLEFMSSPDGRLLEWVPPIGLAAPDPSAAVSGAPTGNRTFVVTPERHIMLFQQGGNIAEFAWCDKEDNTNWNFADVASEAGTLPVEPASPIVTAKNIGTVGTLFFTLKRAFLSSYIGKPDIYNADELNESAIPMTSAMVARAGDQAHWLSESGAWRFNGVSIEPVPCDIWEWIKEEMDFSATRNTGCAIHITSRAEIWYFFSSSSTDYNDRLAIFNYRDGWWAQSYFGRSCGYAEDAIDNPIMADRKMVYKHESGSTYDGLTEGPWLESFTLNVAGGVALSTFRQMVPEVVGDASRLSFQIATRNVRNPDVDVYSPKRKLQRNGYVDFMTKSRDFRLKISADDINAVDWRIGSLLVDIAAAGKKTGNK